MTAISGDHASRENAIAHVPEISVIIPNLNGVDYLRQCLSSLRNQTFENYEVIIVDNGSGDGSAGLIKEFYPWVRLIELSENMGFSAACNKGIHASEAKYVVVLNNDTEVVPHWLERLHESMNSGENIGMVGSKVLLNMETREIDSAGMLIYPDGLGRQKGRGEIDKGQFDNETEMLFPHGCAAMYRREMLEEIGCFDDDFFAYGEDTDIGLRGRLAGWRAVLSPMAVVYHKYSVTAGKYSSFKAIHLERNRLWVAIKNFPATWLLRMPFYTIKRYVYQLYSAAIGKGSAARYREKLSLKDFVVVVIKAYVSAFKGLPLMLKKRRNIKRRISNREFSNILKKFEISLPELVLKD